LCGKDGSLLSGKGCRGEAKLKKIFLKVREKKKQRRGPGYLGGRGRRIKVLGQPWKKHKIH
jgi:hypothetical protein